MEEKKEFIFKNVTLELPIINERQITHPNERLSMEDYIQMSEEYFIKNNNVSKRLTPVSERFEIK